MNRNFGNRTNKLHAHKKSTLDEDDDMVESTTGFFGNINGIPVAEKKKLNNNNSKPNSQQQQDQDQQQQQPPKPVSTILGKRGAAKQEAMADMAAQGGVGVKVAGMGNKTILPAFGTRVIASENEWKTPSIDAREEAEKRMLGILKRRYLNEENNNNSNKKKGAFKPGTAKNKGKAGKK
jgi:hypothetical protein